MVHIRQPINHGERLYHVFNFSHRVGRGMTGIVEQAILWSTVFARCGLGEPYKVYISVGSLYIEHNLPGWQCVLSSLLSTFLGRKGLGLETCK